MKSWTALNSMWTAMEEKMSKEDLKKYREELDRKETAKMMKMSVSGVRKRLSALRSYAKQCTGE